jgi:hypothetical protein
VFEGTLFTCFSYFLSPASLEFAEGVWLYLVKMEEGRWKMEAFSYTWVEMEDGRWKMEEKNHNLFYP